MKKKRMILVCLLAAVLTGCGNGDGRSLPGQSGESAKSGNEIEAEDGNGIETESGNRSEVENEGESGTGNSTGPDTTDGEAEGRSGTENSAGSDTADRETGSAAGSNLREAELTDEEEERFVFGDSATMDNSVNGRELPIYCVDTEEKKVALSFDAAWGNEDTAELLAILEEHDLKVTFFMTGGWVESYPEDVRAILEAGHDLGNHSENHKNMSELSDEEKKEEIMSVHRKVQEITGYEMFLFRPPYGDYDNALIDVLKENEYYAIQWDVDSLDWKNEGVDEILQTVMEHKNLGNGSIILCHNGAEYTAEALDTLIDELEAQGYEIVPISELIYKDHYHMNAEGRQISDETG